ncbi:hypothetical protein [Roseomonas sp. WA12]
MSLIPSLRSPGVVNPAVATGIRLPGELSVGLIAYHELAGSLEIARRNLANPMAPLAQVGTPTFEANGVVLTGGTNYLTLGFGARATYTVALICKAESPVGSGAGGQIALVSNYPGSGASGDSLTLRPQTGTGAQADPAGLLAGYAGFGGTSRPSVVISPNVQGWRLRLIRFVEGSGMTVHDLTTGEVRAEGYTSARNVRSANLALGSLPENASYAGVSRHLRFAAWARDVPPAEHTVLRAFLAAQAQIVSPAIVV